MSKTLKRVPLDFSWPLRTTWQGYINPYRPFSCTPCKGTGSSPEYRRLHDEWYGYASFDPVAYGSKLLTADNPRVEAFARRNVDSSPGYYQRDKLGELAVFLEAQRLCELWNRMWCHHLSQADVDVLVQKKRLTDFTHCPRTEEQRARHKNGWMRRGNGYRPTAQEVNDWAIGGMGHDAINSLYCCAARAEREGIHTRCGTCGGSGQNWPTKRLRRQHELWKPSEPPEGEGFQLWGDEEPLSRVFETLEDLCTWCAAHCHTFGSHMTIAAEWRRMLDMNFVYHVEQIGDRTAIFM